MPPIKTMNMIVDKWNRRAAVAGPDYEAGVKNPRRAWDAAAKGANDAWKTGTQSAIAADRFSKGVTAAGNDKWQSKSIDKGVTRFPQGVQVSGPDYEAGFGPIAAKIASTTLPQRYPKGDPRNIERVRVMAAANRAAAGK
jgi:hypothetical protein